MRNVKRPSKSKPVSLKKNAAKWTKDLLSKIEECKHNKTEVPEAFYNHYNQSDVKEQLKIIYNSFCCYCEGRTGVVEFGNIEHRKPKKKFPKDTYNWNNLHLGCTRCNTIKGQKYDKINPILDAVKDNIPQNLTYEINHRGCWPKALTKRGETTIQHTELTDENLRIEWTKVFNEAIGLIGEINKKQSSDPGVSKTHSELNKMCSDLYGSVVDYAKQTYLSVGIR